jgi:type IV pilus assembly protein PilQ
MVWIAVAAGLMLMPSAGARADEAATQPSGDGSPAAAQGDQVLKTSRPGVFEEFHMRDADLRGVLELLSRQGRVNIVATRDVTGKVAAVDLYNVTFEEALKAVLRATGYVSYRENGSVYVTTPKQLAEIEKAKKKLEIRTFRLAYVTATDAKTLITPALSSDGSAVITPAAAVGVPSSKVDAGGNQYAADDVLVVRDYKEHLEAIARIIDEVDVRPDQVLIEATILRVSLEEDNALGFDFNALSGVNFDTLSSTTNGLQNLTTGSSVATSALNESQATFRTDLNAGLDPGGLTIGFISNSVGFFIRAMESVSDLTILANPKLLVINKQRGEVMVGNRDGYLTTTVTETTATQTVEFLETGTRLVVRPYIGRDGFIRMELHPEDSSGGVEQVGTSVLPTESTTEVTSNVMVRDGHTIVIGGLFRERTDTGRNQVPFFGNIPYLGALARQTSDDTTREEVIILVTPHIVNQAADEAVSAQIKDDVERFRLGQRKGMAWWGRDRLAQSFMRWARQELAAGDREKALWNVDMALSMQPRMEEAIRLKERLVEQAYWQDETRMSSVRYVIERMIMQDLGKPFQPVVPPERPRDPSELPEDVRGRFGVQGLIEPPLPPGGVRLTDLVEDENLPVQAPVETPVAEAPATAAPVIEATEEVVPTTEAPVEEAPVKEAPVSDAVEKGRVQPAPPEDEKALGHLSKGE